MQKTGHPAHPIGIHLPFFSLHFPPRATCINQRLRSCGCCCCCCCYVHRALGRYGRVNTVNSNGLASGHLVTWHETVEGGELARQRGRGVFWAWRLGQTTQSQSDRALMFNLGDWQAVDLYMVLSGNAAPGSSNHDSIIVVSSPVVSFGKAIDDIKQLHLFCLHLSSHASLSPSYQRYQRFETGGSLMRHTRSGPYRLQPHQSCSPFHRRARSEGGTQGRGHVFGRRKGAMDGEEHCYSRATAILRGSCSMLVSKNLKDLDFF